MATANAQAEHDAEYIIALQPDANPNYTQYLLKRIRATGLSVQLITCDDSPFLAISTSKQWLVHDLSTEEHMEQYLAMNVKDTHNEEMTRKMRKIEKLPKSAIIPSMLLTRHIIHRTLCNLDIDEAFVKMVRSDADLKHRQLKLVPGDKIISLCRELGAITDTDKGSKLKLWRLFFSRPHRSAEQNSRLFRRGDFLLLCVDGALHEMARRSGHDRHCILAFARTAL